MHKSLLGDESGVVYKKKKSTTNALQIKSAYLERHVEGGDVAEVQVRGQEALVAKVGLLPVRRVAGEAVPEEARQQGLGLHGPAALEGDARDGAGLCATRVGWDCYV